MPALTISPEKRAFLIEKAREFDLKEGDSDPDSGSNGADDEMIDVLEDNGRDPVQRELTGFIDALTEDEQVDLVALMRLAGGRGRGAGARHLGVFGGGSRCWAICSPKGSASSVYPGATSAPRRCNRR